MKLKVNKEPKPDVAKVSTSSEQQIVQLEQ